MSLMMNNAYGQNPPYAVQYDQNGGGQQSVYGVPMTKRAAGAASNFMHSQVSICCLMTTASTVSLIFGFIIMGQFSNFTEDLKYLAPPTTTPVPGSAEALDVFNNAEALKTAEQQQEEMMTTAMSHYWIIGLFHVLISCCVGLGVVGIGRYFLDSRNKGGLRFCCIFEGICAGCACCECIGVTIYFILAVIFVSLTSDGSTMCNHIRNGAESAAGALNGALDAVQTTPAPVLEADSTTLSPLRLLQAVTTTGSLSDPEFAKCVSAVEGLHGAAVIFAANFAIVACIVICYVCSCASGAKFADETEKLIDDEMGPGGEYYY